MKSHSIPLNSIKSPLNPIKSHEIPIKFPLNPMKSPLNPNMMIWSFPKSYLNQVMKGTWSTMANPPTTVAVCSLMVLPMASAEIGEN